VPLEPEATGDGEDCVIHDLTAWLDKVVPE